MYYKYTKEEEASRLCFVRKQRFVDNYNINIELNYLLFLFNNLDILHRDGLIKTYKKLKSIVIENNVIGIILYGCNLSKKHNIKIGDYLNNDNKNIELYPRTICLYLIKEYFNKEEIKNLCEKTINFRLYYNN